MITGAAGGVGKIVTRAWLASGASVLAVDASDRHHEALRAFVGETDRLFVFSADLTSAEGALSMVREADRVFGGMDTLVHLVGGFAMGEFTSDETASDWERMIALNLNTSFHCFRAVIPGLRARGGGWIVAMGSKAVNAPPARTAAYVATKAALVGMALSVSEEVKGDGIHVNIIQAATIDTPANRADMGDKAAEKWVRAEDVAEATLYLCSERAGSSYGATLELYGKQ